MGLVQTQIDLQSGFGGQMISIEVNGIESFQAILSKNEPHAGPLASFCTYLPRGKNRIVVHWRSQNLQLPAHEDSIFIDLGEAEKYYVGLEASGDTLIVRVQDHFFGYALLLKYQQNHGRHLSDESLAEHRGVPPGRDA